MKILRSGKSLLNHMYECLEFLWYSKKTSNFQQPQGPAQDSIRAVNSIRKDDSKFCSIHQRHDHTTDKCFTLKRILQNYSSESNENPSIENRGCGRDTRGRGRSRRPVETASIWRVDEIKTIFEIAQGLAGRVFEMLLDSGATVHIVPSYFTPFLMKVVKIPPRHLKVANGQTITVTSMGEMTFIALGNHKMTLTEVLVSDDVSGGILSTGSIIEKGGEIVMKGDNAFILKDGRVMTHAIRKGKAYVLPIMPAGPTNTNDINNIEASEHISKIDIMTLHVTMAHVRAKMLYKTIKDHAFEDISIEDIKEIIGKCPCCMVNKAKKTSHPEERIDPPTEVLGLLQADSSGMLPPTVGGQTSFQLISDRKSRFLHGDLAKSKESYPGLIESYVNEIEHKTNKKVKAIQTDEAREYNSKWYREFLASRHITKETSAPYEQAQNGLAERNMDTIKRMVSCMLWQSGLSIGYWGEALLYAIEIRNVIPLRGSMITPYEQMFNKKPKIKRFHLFGCEVYALIPPPRRKAFHARAERCVFLGFQPEYEAYRLLRLPDRKVIITNSAQFRDDCFPLKEDNCNSENTPTFISITLASTEDNQNHDHTNNDLSTNETTIAPSTPNEHTNAGEETDDTEPIRGFPKVQTPKVQT